ncbi:hypothetical protein BDV10DRAFT_187776 [Aspergillus recurvatus]
MTTTTKRPVRIANCSGAISDPGGHMYNQAKYGPVDVITGDYLAQVNLAEHAEAAVQQSLEPLDEKRVKVVINGGALNAKGLAERTVELIQQKGLNMTVAYVDGDNLTFRAAEILSSIKNGSVQHLNSANDAVRLEKDTLSFLGCPDEMPIVTANAYLGYRAIKRGLDEDADIIICGCVADASQSLVLQRGAHEDPMVLDLEPRERTSTDSFGFYPAILEKLLGIVFIA